MRIPVLALVLVLALTQGCSGMRLRMGAAGRGDEQAAIEWENSAPSWRLPDPGPAFTGISTVGGISQLSSHSIFTWYDSKLDGQKIYYSGDIRQTLQWLNSPLGPVYSKEYLKTAAIVQKVEMVAVAGTFAYLLAQAAGWIK